MQKLKNNEVRPNFTGSYKKACIWKITKTDKIAIIWTSRLTFLVIPDGKLINIFTWPKIGLTIKFHSS